MVFLFLLLLVAELHRQNRKTSIFTGLVTARRNVMKIRYYEIVEERTLEVPAETIGPDYYSTVSKVLLALLLAQSASGLRCFNFSFSVDSPLCAGVPVGPFHSCRAHQLCGGKRDWVPGFLSCGHSAFVWPPQVRRGTLDENFERRHLGKCGLPGLFQC